MLRTTEASSSSEFVGQVSILGAFIIGCTDTDYYNFFHAHHRRRAGLPRVKALAIERPEAAGDCFRDNGARPQILPCRTIHKRRFRSTCSSRPTQGDGCTVPAEHCSISPLVGHVSNNTWSLAIGTTQLNGT